MALQERLGASFPSGILVELIMRMARALEVSRQLFAEYFYLFVGDGLEVDAVKFAAPTDHVPDQDGYLVDLVVNSFLNVVLADAALLAEKMDGHESARPSATRMASSTSCLPSCPQALLISSSRS